MFGHLGSTDEAVFVLFLDKKNTCFHCTAVPKGPNSMATVHTKAATDTHSLPTQPENFLMDAGLLCPPIRDTSVGLKPVHAIQSLTCLVSFHWKSRSHNIKATKPAQKPPPPLDYSEPQTRVFTLHEDCAEAVVTRVKSALTEHEVFS